MNNLVYEKKKYNKQWWENGEALLLTSVTLYATVPIFNC